MKSVLALILFIAVVSNAKTILWTNAGGNPLWNNAGNWDCGCLPTADDDVIIDIQSIRGNVQIGGIQQPAEAKSLTIGGTSKFTQTLTLTGPLTIGAGGGVLNSNGALIIESSPSAPFINRGTFTSRGGAFVFETGVLGGPGSFQFPSGSLLNFSSSAAKGIAAEVIVGGNAVSVSDGTPIQLTAGGKLTIDGTFKASGSLVISSDSTSSFVVGKGQFQFTGASLSIQGGANLAKWSLGSSSSAVIINSLVSGDLSLSSGSSLRLIGSPTDKRTFGTITGTTTGSSSVSIEGGSNTFSSVSAGSLSATGGSAAFSAATVGSLTIGGSTVTGVSVTASSASITSGTINGGLTVAADSLSLGGVVNVNGDGSSLVARKQLKFSASSQLTLTGAATFNVNSGAAVTHTSDFKLVQGPPGKTSPSIIVNGAWTSSANWAIFGIPVTGSGSYSLTKTGTWSFTNVNFTGSAINSAGSINVAQGNFNVTNVKGTGSISGSPSNLSVQSFEAGAFTLASGSAIATNGSISALNINGGTFKVAQSLNVGTFTFSAGSVTGTTPSAKIVASSTVFAGTTTTLNSVQLISTAISLNCGGNCQLFTNNAKIRTA